MALSLISTSLLLVASLSSHVSAVELEFHKEGHTSGCIHMPVVHSTNVDRFTNKRGVQLQLANRSDIAYYAQRTTSPLLTLCQTTVLLVY